MALSADASTHFPLLTALQRERVFTAGRRTHVEVYTRPFESGGSTAATDRLLQATAQAHQLMTH
jgi:hypothetical protein